MKKMVRFIFISLAVFSFAFSAFSAEKMNVSGSTTVLPIMQIVAEEFMYQNPDVNITVSGGGSGVGIAALIDKITDIAMSSRQIKTEELDKAVAKGLSIQEFEIAKDAITVIVSPANTKMNQIDSQTLNRSIPEQSPTGKTSMEKISQSWLFPVIPILEPLKFLMSIS